MTGTTPQVPRKFRFAFFDKAAAREALRRIKAWQCRRVLMAHGTPVVEDGSVFIDNAFAWLEK